ncbi:MAG: diaminopimelate epimerase [Alphaproteobacteria bacterium]|nr:diaminopimelate epimerase [Alphaproteobacteria bacterium]
MTRSFLKMHGLGNDFVLFDGRADGFLPDAALCRKIADRHRGVGYDQLIVLGKPKSGDADVFMHMFNADGSEAGACGNATRCVARLLFEETGRREGVVQTISGLLKVWKEAEDLYAVDFGLPRLDWQEIPLAQEADTLAVKINVDGYADPCCVSMGNPHAVFFVEDIAAVPLASVGPKLETHPVFPARANIEFAQILDRAHIRMRVWERGTGITKACGSGSSATLVAAVRRGLADRRATILLDGGELMVEWRQADDHVILMGPATHSFNGEIAEEF